MSIETLKAALPEYAKDLKLNLGAITRTTALDTEQLWGTLLASAAAAGDRETLAAVEAEAAQVLSTEARHGALGAAAIMGMNNVFYRSRHFLGADYDGLRTGLRMNIIGNPGVGKANFELWCLAVSAVNGCSDCLMAHERAVREAGIGKEAVFEAVKAASIVSGVAQAITAARILADSDTADA